MTFTNPSHEKSAQKGRKKGGGDNRKRELDKRLPKIDWEKIRKQTFKD